MANTIPKIPDVPWRACLWAGLTLVVLATTGGFFLIQTPLVIKYEFLIIPLFVLGAVLMCAALLPVLADYLKSLRTHGDTFDFGSIEKTYKATIVAPKPNAILPVPIFLSGTLKKAPPADGSLKIWLINHGTENGPACWPYTEVSCEGAKWSVNYTARNYNDMDERRLRLYAVGKDGQALLQYFTTANKHHAKGDPSVRWPGIHSLTKIWCRFLLNFDCC